MWKKAVAGILLVGVVIAAAWYDRKGDPQGIPPQVRGAAGNTDPADALRGSGRENDTGIRFIGRLETGRLLIRPASQAYSEPLGAPSCYGQEADTRWTGDYEAVWETDGSDKVLYRFSDGMEIIQPGRTPIDLPVTRVGDTDILVYTPRYTDCHGRETYLFGVQGGEAFSIPLYFSDQEERRSIERFPTGGYKFDGTEWTVPGGMGAGQDILNVYHFRYDTEARRMNLQRIDSVTPDQLEDRLGVPSEQSLR